jgi:hypothetical protein
MPASAPAISRLFVLPVATRWWVLTDNSPRRRNPSTGAVIRSPTSEIETAAWDLRHTRRRRYREDHYHIFLISFHIILTHYFSARIVAIWYC